MYKKNSTHEKYTSRRINITCFADKSLTQNYKTKNQRKIVEE